jgi:primosomal protein N' (replication factor Y)
MNVITVIPLSRSKIGEELVYFTSQKITLGSIITVPLRKKTIYAIVSKIEEGRDIKSQIKNASFELKKIENIQSTYFFPEYFINRIKKISEYYATTSGSVIEALTSKVLMENIESIEPPQQNKILNTDHSRPRVLAVQGDDNDRISSWRSMIRQEFASKRSLAFYLPTIEECRQLFEALQKGIEDYIYILNSDLNQKKLISTWNKIAKNDHPIVIIATGSFALLPRTDIKNVIIERENARGWIQQKRPYLDLRHAIIELSNENNQNIYLADTILRIETLENIEKEKYEYGSPFKWRSISSAQDILVDQKKKHKSDNIANSENDYKNINERKGSFNILSEQLKELIKKNNEESTHLFIFALRRGLSPLTSCDDCGTIVMCNNCQSPVVLYTSEGSKKHYFMCHRCGERRSADELCKNCTSWKLTPLGIGIDKVQDEIKKSFPKIDIFKIDSDTTKTEKEIRDRINKFKEKPGSILLGTELAMQNFNEKVEHIAIVSLDSLFSLPDFRIQEKINYNITRLRHQAIRTILVQTRRAEQKIFDYSLKGNISDFYRSSIEERRMLNYPPYSILIKITIEGKKESIANTMADVAKFLEPHEIDIFPAFTSTVKGKSIIHGLIKVASHAWPDLELVKKLISLPPIVGIKVNPETLL